MTTLTCTPYSSNTTCNLTGNIPACSEWCYDSRYTQCDFSSSEVVGPYESGQQQTWYCKPATPSTPSAPSTPSGTTPSTSTDACYLVDHKYVWATKSPNNGNLVTSIKDKNNCAGCEVGYTLNNSDKCVSTTTPPENPKTGTAAIIFAWVIGLLAIGYSFWYFKKVTTN